MSVRKAKAVDKMIHGEELSEVDSVKEEDKKKRDVVMEEEEVPVIVVQEEVALPAKTLAAEVQKTVPRKKTTPSNTFKVKSSELKQKIEELRQKIRQNKS